MGEGGIHKTLSPIFFVNETKKLVEILIESKKKMRKIKAKENRNNLHIWNKIQKN